MVAKYVNINSISRKLKGRLKLNNTDEFYPVELVEEDLINDVVEETETYVDLILSQLYELPLKGAQPVIKNVVEYLVMAELLDYNTSSTGSELRELSSTFRKKALDILFQLTVGTNVVIPGADMSGYIPGSSRRLKLDGESLKTDLPETTVVHRDNLFDTIAEDTNNTNYLNDDYWDNPFSMDWRNEQH